MADGRHLDYNIIPVVAGLTRFTAQATVTASGRHMLQLPLPPLSVPARIKAILVAEQAMGGRGWRQRTDVRLGLLFSGGHPRSLHHITMLAQESSEFTLEHVNQRASGLTTLQFDLDKQLLAFSILGAPLPRSLHDIAEKCESGGQVMLRNVEECTPQKFPFKRDASSAYDDDDDEAWDIQLNEVPEPKASPGPFCVTIPLLMLQNMRFQSSEKDTFMIQPLMARLREFFQNPSGVSFEEICALQFVCRVRAATVFSRFDTVTLRTILGAGAF